MNALRWSRETVVAAFAAWIAEHGRTPTFNEWATTPPGMPSREAVRRHCGSWSAGMEAAGGERRTRGEYDRAPWCGPRKPARHCEHCGEEFYLGWNGHYGERYCSSRCMGLDRRVAARAA